MILPSEDKILSYLQNNLSSELVSHSERVAKMAEKLTKNSSVDPQKAQVAGLIHDLAKEKSAREVEQLALESEWEIDQQELNLGCVLHAPAGAREAKKELGIKDQEILEAVRFHTIGSPKMGKLAQIIFLVDMIEPGRDFVGCEKLRQLATKDFKLALRHSCDNSLAYNIDQARIIHPNTLYLRNSLLKGEQGNGQTQ